MGIVHAAIYDAAVAIEGSFRPYGIALTAPVDTSPEAAIAAAVHGVLVGLLPEQQADLDARYADYLAGLPDDSAKINGITIGEQVAAASLRFVRTTVGTGTHSTFSTRPVPLCSKPLFWTDHDLRQWNEGMLRLAFDQGLDFLQAARMLAMAHVSGSDAMIACFDAKYHYMFWCRNLCDPIGGDRRERCDGPRSYMGAVAPHSEPSGVPFCPRMPQQRGGRGAGCILR
jgi:hypothetical protein